MNLYETIFLKQLYTIISILLTLSIFTSLFKHSKGLQKLSIFKDINLYLFATIIAIFIGSRDALIGTDSKTYKYIFEYKILSGELNTSQDILWSYYNYLISKFTDDYKDLFLITAVGYIFLPLLGVRKYLKDNTIYFFLLFLISPNFFLYGGSGIRNGLAASIFLFSLRYYDISKSKQYLLMSIASLIHLSMAVPSLIFIGSKFIPSLRGPVIIWLILFILTISGFNLFNYVPSLDRLDLYTSQNIMENGLTGRLVNFFTYSISPLVVAFYVINIKKKSDILYHRLLVTYILANCIYIIAFRAPYAERFAYLSEFLMPLLIIYPLIRFNLWKFIEIKISFILYIIFMLKAYKVLFI